MVTETDRVEQALRPLRARGCEIDLGELVVLGARRKLSELRSRQRDEEERRRMRERFVQLGASGSLFDLDAALEVRDRGWTHG